MRASSCENLLMPYATNKGADQPAHPRSLISSFVVRRLSSIISLVSIFEISSLYLASVAAQAGLSLPWSQTPKTGFLVTWLVALYIIVIYCYGRQTGQTFGKPNYPFYHFIYIYIYIYIYIFFFFFFFFFFCMTIILL